jgi:hypothetical protein
MSKGDLAKALLGAARLFMAEDQERAARERIREEAARPAQLAETTARLRELRLAKEAAERKAILIAKVSRLTKGGGNAD